MKVIKIIETRINIDNINDMFCSNYNEKILQILKKLYIRKCFKSIYILDVNKIITRSDLHCKNKLLDGGTYIDISFEVLGVIYEKGEIIHNCKIIQINNNGTMHAKSEYASINIKNIDGLVVVKENDEIPVIVHMMRCNIYEEEISVLAIPFVPIVEQSIVYNITSGVKNNDINFDAINNTLTALNVLKKDNKSVYKFFTELLYPYKLIKSIPTSMEINEKNLENIAVGDLIHIPESHLDTGIMCVLTHTQVEKLLQPNTIILDISKKDYIIYAMNIYYNRLQTLYEFLITYNTPEKIKDKSQIWSLYALLKK